MSNRGSKLNEEASRFGRSRPKQIPLQHPPSTKSKMNSNSQPLSSMSASRPPVSYSAAASKPNSSAASFTQNNSASKESYSSVATDQLSFLPMRVSLQTKEDLNQGNAFLPLDIPPPPGFESTTPPLITSVFDQFKTLSNGMNKMQTSSTIESSNSLIANGSSSDSSAKIEINMASGDQKNNETLSELEIYKNQQVEVGNKLAKKLEQVELRRQTASNLLKNFRRGEVSPEITKQVQSLPIFKKKKEFLDLVANNQIVIIVGETGSGKSTQIPQYLMNAGYGEKGMIGCTQPRRIAAKSIAARVSAECGVNLGTIVGYAVRFDRLFSKETVIKYMTDGLLLKEFIKEPKLDSYSVIIIDEAHERSINSDVCFGLLKGIAMERPNLKIIITSATLDSEKFSAYFHNAPILQVKGHSHDVEVIYERILPPHYNYIQEAVEKVLYIHINEPKGDILGFLPGIEEINKVWTGIDQKARERNIQGFIIRICHGSMSLKEQQLIYKPTEDGLRKIVLATNIAETSLTIDGIVYVVDCGYYKQKEFNPKNGIESLKELQITQAQGIQREGRAGRTCPGKAYRLYTEKTFKNLGKSQTPEIQRSNLESAMLDLISMGVEDIVRFEFMDSPKIESIFEALIHLQELGALDRNVITDLGRKIVQFPLDPPLAKTLVESAKLDCSEEMVTIVSLLSSSQHNLFNRDKSSRTKSDMKKAHLAHEDGDHLTFLNIYDEWKEEKFSEVWCKENFIEHRVMLEAKQIREQLCRIMEKNDLPIKSGGGADKIKKAIVAGYFRRAAVKSLTSKSEYSTFTMTDDEKNRATAMIHPSSVLYKSLDPHKWLIYHEMCTTTTKPKPLMRNVVEINPQHIKEYAPRFVERMAKIFPEMSIL